MELPKYKSHKVVEAAKIVSVSWNGTSAMLSTNAHIPIIPEKGWHARYKGSEEDLGYFVRYEDGHESWSPSKAFEEGYSLIDDCITPEYLEDAGIVRKPNPRAGLRPVEMAKMVIGEDGKWSKVPDGKGYFHRFAQWCIEGEAGTAAVVERPNGEIVEVAAGCVRFTDVEPAND